MYRRWRESNGKDNEYPNIIRKQAQAARVEAEKEGIVVPLTREEYCIKNSTKTQEPQLDVADFYDDDYIDEDSESEDGKLLLYLHDRQFLTDQGHFFFQKMTMIAGMKIPKQTVTIIFLSTSIQTQLFMWKP